MKRLQLHICLLLLSLGLVAQQPRNQQTMIGVSGTIADEGGKPVPGAYIFASEGRYETLSLVDGSFSFAVPVGAMVYVEADGFESTTVGQGAAADMGTITLIKMPFHLAGSDQVGLPFGSLEKRRIAGAAHVINVGEIQDYDTRQGVLGALGGRVPGLYGTTNIRGLGDALLIVDGIPRDPNTFNLQEVEQITVLKDVTARLLYGSQASNGVILVTTKRGQANHRDIRLTMETGFSTPHSYPVFLGAADYMTLYNEALDNDGQAPLYTQEQIDNTRAGIDPVRYPDINLLNDQFVKSQRPFSTIITEFSGGNNSAQYYLNIGYGRTGTFQNFGEGATENDNRLNIRGNVDYRVNDIISANLDVVTVFDFNHSALGDFWGATAGETEGSNTLHPNSYPLLIDTHLVAGNPLLQTANVLPGGYLLGGTSQFARNPYGDLAVRGYGDVLNRTAQLNTGLTFDLQQWAPGLKLQTYLSFDIYNTFQTQLENQYAVYEPAYATGSNGQDSLYLIKYGDDNLSGTQSINDVSFFRRLGYYGLLTYRRDLGSSHSLDVTGLAYTDQLQPENGSQNYKNLHFGFRANYMFRKKYVAELSGAYTGSMVFAPESRWGFSPALALGWVLTEEAFLQNSSLIQYLKIKASAGIINTDQGITNYNLSRTLFQTTNNFNYGDGQSNNNQLQITNLGNPALSFAHRQEVNAGLEAMLGKSVWLEANYFLSNLTDIIGQQTNSTPAYLGGLIPYTNFGTQRNQGVEAGLQIQRQLGDLGISLGANMVYAVPLTVEIDEPVYVDDYLYRAGLPSDARFGLVAMGLFADSTEILNHPTQTFGPVKPGDIKYEDLNGDGIIDQNDQRFIGNASARLQYGLQINLTFKGFELFALGSGQSGQTVYLNSPYFWMFGDRAYSEMVLGRWTPATAATATYPRLSATNSTNNFRNSTYWLRDNNGLRLNAVQLTYNFPTRIANKLNMSRLAVYVRGSNLLDFSERSDVRLLNVGAAPQTRNYAGGLRIFF